MIVEISGAKNPKIKLVKSLLKKKYREKMGMYTIEGIKSVGDAISAGADIDMIFVSESFINENNRDFKEHNIYVVADNIFETLCDTKTPQGILAVINIANKKELTLDNNKMYIYCDTVQDPGNLGTIIRTADAAGFGGVLLSEGCADLYSPKTIRSSMGSFFHIPLYEGITGEDIIKFKEKGFSFYATALCEDTIDYKKADFKKPVIVAVGNEANGMSDDMLALADSTLKIKIYGKAESLNVGVASALLMYEAVEQREKLVD